MPIFVKTRGKKASKVFRRTYPQIAAEALTLAKKNKAELSKQEKKAVDQNFTQATVLDSGTFQPFNLIQSGDRPDRRIGRIVENNYLMCDMWIEYNVTSTYNALRIMVVKDKQANGAQFTLADLLEDSTTVDNLVSPKLWDNRNRFVIAYDKLIHVGDASRKGVAHKIRLKCSGKTTYDGDTASIADIVDTNYCLVLISDQAVNGPDVTAYLRFYFGDP